MHIVNWHELNTAELTIYTAYQFIDCCPEILVFFHVASRGDSDLDKDDLLLTLQQESTDRQRQQKGRDNRNRGEKQEGQDRRTNQRVKG